MTAIRYENITKEYESGTRAVDSISFGINPGEFMVLVGPSGCGKSTTLRMTAGLEGITGGEIFFNDKRMNAIHPKDRNIGMVFQNYALYPHMTVFDNIAFPLKVKKIKKIDIQKSVAETAEITGLGGLLGRKPKQLSGGQRQRVALARAIVRKPDVFLFDEPLSNLDAKLRVQMRNEIIALQRRLGVTSIYVTHDQTEAMTMGDRIAVMDTGKIRQIDTPDNLYNFPADLFVAAFLGSPQMNLFEGKIENGDVFREKSGAFSASIGRNLPAGNYTLGIRPEDIMMNEGVIAVKISNIEFLGHETLLYFELAGELRCCRISGRILESEGSLVDIGFPQSKIHIFDAEGERVR